MAQWGWSSPFQWGHPEMETNLLPGNEINEGHGQVNFGFQNAKEESKPDYADLQDDIPDYDDLEDDIPDYDDSEVHRPDYDDLNPVESEVDEPDYEKEEEIPDYDEEPETGGIPSTTVPIPTDHEGQEPDDGLGSAVFENDAKVILWISGEPEDSGTSGIESFENQTGSVENCEKEEELDDDEDELETRSVRTMEPETVRMKGWLRTWKRGVAPLLVQGAMLARTIRLRMRDVEALKEQEEAAARVRSKRDFIIFIDEKKKQSMANTTKEKSKGEKQKEKRAKKWRNFKSKVKDFFGIFALWKSTFKNIEGHFGAGTVSYFRFVRWLLLINLFSSLVIICSIVLPQILLPPSHFEETLNCSAYNTTTDIPEVNYTLRPETTAAFIYDMNVTELLPKVGNYKEEIGIREACSCTKNYTIGIVPFKGRMWYLVILDILQGTEWMELSVLFLGYYFDKPSYLSSLAFLFAILGCFVVILWLIVLYIGSAIRTNVVENAGANKHRYSENVFCCWDHNLTSEKAAGRKAKQFYYQIVNDMKRDLEDMQQKQMPRWMKFGIFVLRLIAAVLITSLLVAAGVFLYFAVTLLIPKLRDIVIADAGLQELFNLLLQYLPSVALVIVNTLLPFLFQLIIKLAMLNEETEFAVLLVLMIFTRLSSVAFLVITLFTQIYDCQPNICHTCSKMPCWENRLGQQMYTLTITDFLIVCFSVLILDTLRRCCCAKPRKNGEQIGSEGGIEFDVSAQVLDVVYTQTICWIGAFFCPLILPITAVKLFIFFYLKKMTLFCNCVPSTRTNRASRFNFYFMIVTLISLIICYFLVTFAIGWLHPSQGCSPFRIYLEADYYIYRSFSFVMLDWPNAAQDFVGFVCSWAFLIIIFVVSIFFICLLSVMASRNRKIARLLEKQILLESKDKLFMFYRAQDAYLKNELND